MGVPAACSILRLLHRGVFPVCGETGYRHNLAKDDDTRREYACDENAAEKKKRSAITSKRDNSLYHSEFHFWT